MIELYFAPTPNARKISIMLEELGAPYAAKDVDILAGAQFDPAFLAINPNNKIPAIVDPDGPGGAPIALWETGAILLNLAEKSARFVPSEPRARCECYKWLMFQVAGLGPMGGQHAFFRFYARETIPLAIERYHNELNRQMRVMNTHLEDHRYFAGDDYTIADVAIYPWWVPVSKYSVEPRPALERWAAEVGARPAVKAGMETLIERLRPEVIQAGLQTRMSDASYSGLYGAGQYADRSGATG